MSIVNVGRKPFDLNGRIFGRLTVLCFAGRNKSKNRTWLCRCECGTELPISSSNLLSGASESCGCLKMEALIKRNTKHGQSKRVGESREHAVWCGMRQRCTNPKSRNWNDYGGRGIRVCERWDSFTNFLADMGPCPDEYTIERKDNNGNYEPSNCIWATRKVQARNKRNVRLYEFNGESRSIHEWSEITGIHVETLRNRLKRYKWSIEKALTTTNDRRFHQSRRLSSLKIPQE